MVMALHLMLSLKRSPVFLFLVAGVIAAINLVLIYHCFFFYTSGRTTCGKPFRVYKLALRPVYLVTVNGIAYLVSEGELYLVNSSQVRGPIDIKILDPDYGRINISKPNPKFDGVKKLSKQGKHLLFEDIRGSCFIEFETAN